VKIIYGVGPVGALGGGEGEMAGMDLLVDLSTVDGVYIRTYIYIYIYGIYNYI